MTTVRGKCMTQLLLLGAIDSIQVWILLPKSPYTLNVLS